MECGKRWGIVVLGLSLGWFIGCGQGGTSQETATTGSNSPNIKTTSPASGPIADAARDFVDAVVKGDTQRASARLTPQAMQRIVASGEQFAPTGLATATFKIGEIRTPSPEQAIVQCILTDSSQGTPQSEEMCCVMRMVENDWRVAGIAYGTTPDKPWVLTDFESGKNMSIPRQVMNGMAGTTNAGGPQSQVATRPNAAPQSLTPPAPLGIPPVAPASANQAVATPSGLGMPPVGAPAASPYQPQAPYTAQGIPGSDRR